MNRLLSLFSADVVAALEELVDTRVAERLAEITRSSGTHPRSSEFLTILEAAELLRCKRARVDDLLSAGRISRVKEGARTLLRRDDVLAYLNDGGERRAR
jgi:excisionase family DNA binding protein